MRNKSKLVNKTIYLVLMVIVLVFGLVACLPTDNKPTNINNNNSLKGNGDSGTKGENKSIDIIYPQTDSVLVADSSCIVKWFSSDDVKHININLYGINIDNKELLVMNIATGIDNTGNYAWEISPNFLTEEGFNFMEDKFKLVISDSDGNAKDSVSYFVITSPISYKIEEETPKGRAGKEDVPNTRIVDIINHRIGSGGDYNIKWDPTSKYIKNVNIYLFKNGEYYQTIAENVSNEGTYKWKSNILTERSREISPSAVIEDSQYLNSVLSNISGGIEFKALNLDSIFNIIILPGNIENFIDFPSESISYPYWRGVDNRKIYCIVRRLVKDEEDSLPIYDKFTEEEKDNMIMALILKYSQEGRKTIKDTRKELYDILIDKSAAYIVPDNDGDGAPDWVEPDIIIDYDDPSITIPDILYWLSSHYMDLFDIHFFNALIEAFKRRGFHWKTSDSPGFDEDFFNVDGWLYLVNDETGEKITIHGNNVGFIEGYMSGGYISTYDLENGGNHYIGYCDLWIWYDKPNEPDNNIYNTWELNFSVHLSPNPEEITWITVTYSYNDNVIGSWEHYYEVDPNDIWHDDWGHINDSDCCSLFMPYFDTSFDFNGDQYSGNTYCVYENDFGYNFLDEDMNCIPDMIIID